MWRPGAECGGRMRTVRRRPDPRPVARVAAILYLAHSWESACQVGPRCGPTTATDRAGGAPEGACDRIPNFGLCALPLARSAPDNSGSGIRHGVRDEEEQ